MKFKELSSLSVEDKSLKIQELKKEMMKLKAQAASGTSPEKSGGIRKLRKEIAKLIKSQRGRA
jgi:ribosomal protein L29